MKNILRFLGIVLLIGLVLTKVSAFHIYEHHDSLNGQEQCEFCLFAIDNQQSETIAFTLNFIAERITVTFQRAQFITADIPTIIDTWKTDLFSRPPPSSFL